MMPECTTTRRWPCCGWPASSGSDSLRRCTGSAARRACRPGSRPANRCRSPRRASRRSRRSRSAGVGAAWGTTWFHVTGEVPAGWTDPDTRPELVVDLGFTTGARVPGRRAWPTRPTGRSWAAIAPTDAGTSRWRPSRAPGRDLHRGRVEPGHRRRLGVPPDRARRPGDRRRGPALPAGRVDLALLDLTGVGAGAGRLDAAWAARRAAGRPAAARRDPARAGAHASTSSTRSDVAGTAPAGRAELAGVLASPAYASAHRMHAVGPRAHRLGLAVAGAGDRPQGGPHVRQRGGAAWSRASRLRVRRVLGAAVRLAAASTIRSCSSGSAAQVAAGQFVPVGGMWVESDTNMPGGEALARQFVAGKRFFLDEFGVEPREVWLPDSFGYSAALPQIVAAAGSPLVPHPEDLLERDEPDAAPHLPLGGHRRHPGLHPLPAGRHLQRGAVRCRAGAGAAPISPKRARANTSLVPFGWGDGGGGPTREMLAAARRTRSLEGSPTVRISHARASSSAAAEAEYPRAAGVVRRAVPGVPPRHLHPPGPDQARQPAQRAPAAGGRAVGDHGRRADRRRLPVRRSCEQLWRTVLLQQFHDILPGHLDRLGAPRGGARVRARWPSELEGVIDDRAGRAGRPGRAT